MRIGRGGFRVHGKSARFFKRDGQFFKLSGVEHQMIFTGRVRRCFARGRKLSQHGAEFKTLEKLNQLFRIRLFEFDVFHFEIHGHVAMNLGQFARAVGQFAVFGQKLSLRFAFHLGQMLVKVLHRPKLFDERERGFGTNVRNARDIVGAVAHQGHDIHDLVRPQPFKPFFHFFLGINHAFLVGAVNFHAFIDQLKHILVAGRDINLVALVRKFLGQSAQNIVRLKPLFFKNGDAQGPDKFLDKGDLLYQIIRHGLAVRLVLRINSMPERGPGQIKTHGHAAGLLLFDHLFQHGDHAVNSVGGLTLRI